MKFYSLFDSVAVVFNYKKVCLFLVWGEVFYGLLRIV